jgi:hypothetical protein
VTGLVPVSKGLFEGLAGLVVVAEAPGSAAGAVEPVQGAEVEAGAAVLLVVGAGVAELELAVVVGSSALPLAAGPVSALLLALLPPVRRAALAFVPVPAPAPAPREQPVPLEQLVLPERFASHAPDPAFS